MINDISYELLEMEEISIESNRELEDIQVSLHHLGEYINKTNNISKNIDKMDCESELERARLGAMIENDLETIKIPGVEIRIENDDDKKGFASKSIETVKKFFAMIWKKIKSWIVKLVSNIEKMKRKVKGVKLKAGDVVIAPHMSLTDNRRKTLTAFYKLNYVLSTLVEPNDVYDLMSIIVSHSDFIYGVDIPEGYRDMKLGDVIDDRDMIVSPMALHSSTTHSVSYIYSHKEDYFNISVRNAKDKWTKYELLIGDIGEINETYSQYVDRITKQYDTLVDRTRAMVNKLEKANEDSLKLKPFMDNEDNPNKKSVMRLGIDVSKGFTDFGKKTTRSLEDFYIEDILKMEKKIISNLVDILKHSFNIHTENLRVAGAIALEQSDEE